MTPWTYLQDLHAMHGWDLSPKVIGLIVMEYLLKKARVISTQVFSRCFWTKNSVNTKALLSPAPPLVAVRGLSHHQPAISLAPLQPPIHQSHTTSDIKIRTTNHQSINLADSQPWQPQPLSPLLVPPIVRSIWLPVPWVVFFFFFVGLLWVVLFLR